MRAVGSRTARMGLVGCCAALAAAAPLGMVLATVESAWAASIWFGLLVGGTLSGFIRVFEQLWYGRTGRMVTAVLAPASFGAVGGAAGAALGQALYGALGTRLVRTASSGISVPLSAGSALGWGITGLAVGLAVTLTRPESRGRWMAAALGGAVGGSVGGALMQVFRPLLGPASMTLGLVALGGAIAFGIAWAQGLAARVRLQVLEGAGRGSEFILDSDTLIGSDPHCPVRITGAGVASKHARITAREGNPLIEDLGSPKGVMVNDRKVAGGGKSLKHGDLVRIGSSLLRVNVLGAYQGATGRSGAAATLLAGLCLILPASSYADTGEGDNWRITQVDASRYPLVDLYATLPGDANPNGITDLAVTEGDVSLSIVEVRDLSTGVRDQPLTVSLVVDTSESMRGAKLDEARRALSRFARTIPSSAMVHLVIFNDTVTVAGRDLAPSDLADRSLLLTAGGHTALFDGISRGVALAEGTPGRRVVVTLTDGMANRGSVSMEEALEAAQRAGVSLLFVGLGPDARKNRLSSMARRTGGLAVYTAEASALSSLFEGFATEISREVLFRYRAASGESQVVPVVLRVSTRSSDIALESRYFSPRATFMGTNGRGSVALILAGMLGVAGLVAASRLTGFVVSRGPVLLVEGSSNATRMLTRVLTRHGMTVPMSIGGETLLVNNQPVTGSATLKPGQTLTWGETTIMYRGK
ncbi:MAG: FHA domain-containing protein [bacterium]|nr:FHA domain-containing protein [bacterium]